MSNLERLKSYYPFAPDVLESVERCAHDQNSHTFRELADAYGIAEGPEMIGTLRSERALEVVKLTPQGDHDENVLRVLHLPMANPVNPNKMMQAIRLFGADPSEALLVVGNPSAPGKSAGSLSARDSIKMLHEHDLRPTVEPLAQYIASLGIRKTMHIGYSYGAEKAVAASGVSAEYEQQTSKTIAIEPPAVLQRSFGQLLRDFGKTNAEQKRYIQQADSPPFQEIWDQEDIRGFVGYVFGLMRMSNIAIGNTLKEPGFEARASQALQKQPRMDLKVIWGSKSELCPDAPLRQITNNLQRAYPHRTGAMVMKGMHHAGADDIDLHAAMVLQAIRY